MTSDAGDRRQRLAVLVHEVRSPVAALSAIADTFPDQSLEGVARLELARLAIAACRGIERIVLDVAMASVRAEPVDVGALVQQVVAAAVLGGARVEAKVADDLPLVAGDPVRLRQAIDKLVTNASVHSGSDGEVVVTAEVNETDVLISVTDFGVGVPVSEQERIFEVGTQLDPSPEGSGLGLAVAQAVVEAHGGRLTLVSAPGEGATFTIALPQG